VVNRTKSDVDVGDDVPVWEAFLPISTARLQRFRIQSGIGATSLKSFGTLFSLDVVMMRAACSADSLVPAFTCSLNAYRYPQKIFSP
jgi:hypothetical protein